MRDTILSPLGRSFPALFSKGFEARDPGGKKKRKNDFEVPTCRIRSGMVSSGSEESKQEGGPIKPGE